MTTRIEEAKQAVRLELIAQDIKFGELDLEIVGSTYIKDSNDRDVDVLVYVPGANLEALAFEGWNYGGSAGLGNSHWMSWKKLIPFAPNQNVEVNMLLTNKPEYYVNWLSAAEVCRFLHLRGVELPSGCVHGVHEIIMEGVDAETEAPRRNY